MGVRSGSCVASAARAAAVARAAAARFAALLALLALAPVAMMLVFAPVAAAGEIALQDVMAGKVPGLTAKATGSGRGYYGDSLAVSFANSTSQSYSIRVPIGLRMVPEDESVQTEYTAGNELITVGPGDSSTPIKGFCGEEHDAGPGSGDTFHPSGFADDGLMDTLRNINDKGIYDATAQDAVWHETDNRDISREPAAVALTEPRTVSAGDAAAAGALAATLATIGALIAQAIASASTAAGSAASALTSAAGDAPLPIVSRGFAGSATVDAASGDGGAGPAGQPPPPAGEPRPTTEEPPSVPTALTPGVSDIPLAGASGEPTDGATLDLTYTAGGADAAPGPSSPGAEPLPPAPDPAEAHGLDVRGLDPTELAQVVDLEKELQDKAQRLKDSGYFVLNPSADSWVGNILGAPYDGLTQIPASVVHDVDSARYGAEKMHADAENAVWGMAGVDRRLVPDTPVATPIVCQDYVAQSRREVAELVKKTFGDKATVEICTMGEASSIGDGYLDYADHLFRDVNHAVIKVTLPSGKTIAIDFWEQARGGGPVVRDWETLHEHWRSRIGSSDFTEDTYPITSGICDPPAPKP